MFIKGTKIALRAMEPADALVLYDWENNRQLWPYSHTQVPFSRFLLEEFVNAAHQDFYTNRQLRVIITELKSDLPIGTLDLFEFEPQHNRCGLGIYIAEAHRRKGFAEESLQLALDYAFKTLLLKQVFVDVNENNLASLTLFEQAGFLKIGLKKCWHRSALNTYENVWLLQCLNPD